MVMTPAVGRPRDSQALYIVVTLGPEELVDTDCTSRCWLS
jgi:hypothetical protein